MSALKLRKLNDEVVRAVRIPTTNACKVRGCRLFPEVYGNVFICARKKSGKSSLIAKILRDCVGRDTQVLIFASTVRKDAVYKEIVKALRNKPIENGERVQCFTDLSELETIMTELRMQSESESESESSSESDEPILGFDREDEKARPKRRKEKLLSPEIIFVFDDLSSELRSPHIDFLLKSNRHYKAKILLSSQWPNDIQPSGLKQLDTLILFKGHSEAKLKKLHSDVDLNIPLDQFVRIYKEVTGENSPKYSFLYIDQKDGTFRRNFTHQIEV